VPYRLTPHEWKSGTERRVIDALGDQQAVQKLFAKLGEQAGGQKSK
jgi:hypothetical protein